MPYRLARSSDQNRYLLLVGLLIVAYFLFVQPNLEMQAKKTEEMFSEALSRCYKLDTNMCSKDCCDPNLWPVSFDTKRDPRIKPGDIGNKFIPSNLTCSGINGRGCVCVTRDQHNMISRRGYNR